ncbi:hypothetical protein B0H13DRAFT_1864740 [Mycena leptocephala]|nr:hypothetical protein B0H13DRAFT_1864740 [Mycena leptocephala]
MSDSSLGWIWSKYTTSPDPGSGMQSLYRTCSVLTKHVLHPSDIILSGGGFTLCPALVVLLTAVVPALDHLLKLAAKHYSLLNTSSLCQTELQVLTCTTGLIVPATLNQIVWHWIHFVDKLYFAMVAMKSFCKNMSMVNPDCDRPSRMSQTLASLPPSLRIKLPKEFLESHGIMVVNLRERHVTHQSIETSSYQRKISSGSPRSSRPHFGGIRVGGPEGTLHAESVTARPAGAAPSSQSSISENGVLENKPADTTSKGDISHCISSIPAIGSKSRLGDRTASISSIPALANAAVKLEPEGAIDKKSKPLAPALVVDKPAVEPGGLDTTQWKSAKSPVTRHSGTLTSQVCPSLRSTMRSVEPTTSAPSRKPRAPPLVMKEEAPADELGRPLAMDRRPLSNRLEDIRTSTSLTGTSSHASLAPDLVDGDITSSPEEQDNAAPILEQQHVCPHEDVLSAERRARARLRATAVSTAQACEGQGPTGSIVGLVVGGAAVERGGLQKISPLNQLSDVRTREVRTSKSRAQADNNNGSSLSQAALDYPAPSLVSTEGTVELGGLDGSLRQQVKSMVVSSEHNGPLTDDSRVTELVLRVPGVRSSSCLRDHALRVVHSTPSPKSPAPAPAIANAVELGGLRERMAEPRPISSMESVPRISTAVDIGQLVADKRSRHVFIPERHSSADVVELGGLDHGPSTMVCKHAVQQVKHVPVAVVLASVKSPPSVSVSIEAALHDVHLDSSPAARFVSADASAPLLANVLPPTKSPAPALAIANTVELGGLPEEEMEGFEHGGSKGGSPSHVSSTVELEGLKDSMLSAELLRIMDRVALTRVHKNGSACALHMTPMLSAPDLIGADLVLKSVVEFGGRDKKVPALATTSSILGAVQPLTPGPVVNETPVELEGLKWTSSYQGQESSALDGRTSLHLERASLEPRSLPSHISPSTPSPSVSFAITDFKMSTLVSMVIQTYWITYLAQTSRRELEPYLAWEREGIGTARSGSRRKGAGTRTYLELPLVFFSQILDFILFYLIRTPRSADFSLVSLAQTPAFKPKWMRIQQNFIVQCLALGFIQRSAVVVIAGLHRDNASSGVEEPEDVEEWGASNGDPLSISNPFVPEFPAHISLHSFKTWVLCGGPRFNTPSRFPRESAWKSIRISGLMMELSTCTDVRLVDVPACNELEPLPSGVKTYALFLRTAASGFGIKCGQSGVPIQALSCGTLFARTRWAASQPPRPCSNAVGSDISKSSSVHISLRVFATSR